MSSQRSRALEERSVVLLGPNGAGKSTAGPLICSMLGLPKHRFVNVGDALRRSFFEMVGLRADQLPEVLLKNPVYSYLLHRAPYVPSQLLETLHLPVLHQLLQPLRANLIRDFMREHERGWVIEVGGTHPIFTDGELLEQTLGALSHSDVVLLLHSTDVEQNIALSRERLRSRESDEFTFALYAGVSEIVLRGPFFWHLADALVYTAGLFPQEVARRTVSQVTALRHGQARLKDSEAVRRLVPPYEHAVIGARMRALGEQLLAKPGLQELPVHDYHLVSRVIREGIREFRLSRMAAAVRAAVPDEQLVGAHVAEGESFLIDLAGSVRLFVPSPSMLESLSMRRDDPYAVQVLHSAIEAEGYRKNFLLIGPRFGDSRAEAALGRAYDIGGYVPVRNIGDTETTIDELGRLALDDAVQQAHAFNRPGGPRRSRERQHR